MNQTYWFLIRWGGTELGKRPRTKLAHSFGRYDPDDTRHFVQLIRPPNRKPYAPRFVNRADILWRWFEHPSDTEIAAARKALKVLT